jgi:hypothetical protein
MKYLLGIFCLALGLASSAVYAEDKGGRDHGGHFQKADTDGDGAVSKAEFLAQAEERFGKMDVNGDGLVTKDEVVAKKEEYKKKIKEDSAKRASERSDAAPAADPAPATDAVTPEAAPAEAPAAEQPAE